MVQASDSGGPQRDVFDAIADPTRRRIIKLLADRSHSMLALADHFESSRQAVAKHVKILSEAGLINIRRNGRERTCHARFDKLKEVADWVQQYQVFWTEKLDALERYLDENPDGD